MANALRDRLRILISSEPRIGERVEVYAIDALGERLYRLNIGAPSFASEAQIIPLIEEAARTVKDTRFSPSFMLTEWNQVVDAWQLDTWEAYRDVPRLGRSGGGCPRAIAKCFGRSSSRCASGLRDRNLITRAQMFSQLTSMFGKTQPSPFEFNVVDEAQDIGVAQLRFLAALGTERPDGLFFAGDLGQRIFQQPFSWQALGVEIRGRSRTLKINYRTSHQIRMRSERLLGPELSDADGNTEERSGTISVFNGAELFPSCFRLDDESKAVATWLTELMGKGLEPHEISVFVRSTGQVSRATTAIEAAGLHSTVLDDQVQTTEGSVSVSTMHLAKGLEFRAVVVMACDDEVIPLQERIESVTDDSDLEDVYNTERHLLYVACTRRARLPPRNRCRASVRVPRRPSRVSERKPMTAAKPIHPGEHLAETLQELGITQYVWRRRSACPKYASTISSTAADPSRRTPHFGLGRP